MPGSRSYRFVAPDGLVAADDLIVLDALVARPQATSSLARRRRFAAYGCDESFR